MTSTISVSGAEYTNRNTDWQVIVFFFFLTTDQSISELLGGQNLSANFLKRRYCRIQ